MTTRGCPRHALASAAPAGTPLPELAFAVDGWEALRTLGAGGFAQVFLARRSSDGLEAAVKVARRPRDARADIELACLRRVGAPCAPKLLEAGVDRSARPYLACEFLEGEALGEWLARRDDDPSVDETLSLFGKLCEAVDRIHACGVVHRDLKPENVFLRANGELTIIDFGLAKLGESKGEPALDAHLTIAGQRFGTVTYMSPEQCRGETDVDERSDLYSLGVILFELLTMRPPFVGDEARVTAEHLLHRPPPPSELRASLPAALDAPVTRALAKRRADRYASAAELMADVERAREQKARPTSSAGSEKPTTRVVALLGLRADLSIADLSAAAATSGGVVARTTAGLHVLAFPSDKPLATLLRSAIRAAAALAPLASDRVIHVAEVRLRRRAQSLTFSGIAIESASEWCPLASQPELLFTDSAARALQPATTTPTQLAGYHRLVAESGDATPPSVVADRLELRGREALIAATVRDARACFAANKRGMTLVLGDVGMGKSRVLGAVATALAPEADVIAVRAVQRASDAVTRELVRAIAARQPQRPLAIVVDDAQWTDAAARAALERASRQGDGPLWILLGARQQLVEQSPDLAADAPLRTRHELEPLGPDDARRMLLDLLSPVEFIPAPVLDRLLQQTAGIPLYLVELAHALRAAGAIRRQRGTEGWYVAADELRAASSVPLAERVAKRMTAGLEEVLLQLLALCAIMGNEVNAHDLDAVQSRLRSAGQADHADVGIGLERLTAAGLLRPLDGNRWAFTHPLLRDAVAAQIPTVQAIRMHAAVHAWLIASPQKDSRLDDVARHAAAAGLRDEASAAYLELARRAEARHRPVEANQSYTAALEQLTDESAREEALTGRGRVRYRTQRFDDALQDLRRARTLAQARGDESRVAHLRLDEAIVLDWMSNAADAAALVDEAAAVAERLDEPALHARVLLGRGRAAFRADRLDEACRLLEESCRRARELGDDETATIALVVLAPTLSAIGQFDAAARRYDEVIALCERTGDRFHLAVAHGNRVPLWIQTRRYDEARRDLDRALVLAREIANFRVESYASLNLATLLFWDGDFERARELTLRALDLERRFEPRAVPDASLLLARVEAARGSFAEAQRYLDWLEANCSPEQYTPSANMMRELARLTIADANNDDVPALRGSWQRLIAERPTSALIGDETLDLLLSATKWAVRRGFLDDARAWLAEASQVRDGATTWHEEIARLSRVVSTTE